ncbi:Shedu immune nuclease family protein [Gracilimonas tropica]|uniref:Shedu immune nuclease family protein n=1 Tax=Gracilimonas tropica TaxID=454600 RepID=UPI00037C2886|nr:Shedu immune nuclease family protein [Gracilimonas tropica]
MAKEIRGEKLEEDLVTKKKYYYYDTENGIHKRLSREVYKKKDEIHHYPRGFDGNDKYDSIKKIIYKGFDNKLPVGVIKSVNYGYGFTRTLSSFAYYIDNEFNIEEVVISKKGQVSINENEKRLYLTEDSLRKLQDSFSVIYKKNKAEVEVVLENVLYELFPNEIDEPDPSYIPDSISTSLSSWGNSIDEFSEDDKSAILDLFEKLSLTSDFLTNESLHKAKAIVDSKYIQEVLKEYGELMSLTTDGESLEKKWQDFLKENSWIFSSIFAQPVILYKDEAYVGGKNIDNRNGKFNDFLIKNNLSNNTSFLEIKTHKTRIIENTAYRGQDVFSTSKDLTGCINQVLNQRDNFQKEFYQIKVKSKENFESFNSNCVVLIGSLGDLTDEQLYSFELFRSNSRDVEILTFDELESKIKSLQDIINK